MFHDLAPFISECRLNGKARNNRTGQISHKLEWPPNRGKVPLLAVRLPPLRPQMPRPSSQVGLVGCFISANVVGAGTTIHLAGRALQVRTAYII